MKKKIVVLSGAGASAESGISTFRDSGGLWDKYPVEQVATPEGFIANPELVLNFYKQRREELYSVEPNDAHRIIAELEKDYDVTVVTQNIDNLHERAGSSKVIHLHGELDKVCSSRNPNDIYSIKTLKENEEYPRVGDLAEDGSQIRPFIVWFGEAVPEIERAADIASRADIFIVVGTSMNVYPAAGLINYVPRKAKVFLIDPKEVYVNIGRDIEIIQDVATKGMKIIKEKIKP